MITKSIIYAGQPATFACDGRCDKAWGINHRPRVPANTPGATPGDPDDVAYLADGELGTAPVDPGTYEGGHAKPRRATGPADINKWCVRECERSWFSPPGVPDAEIALPDFRTRRYNFPPATRDEPKGI